MKDGIGGHFTDGVFVGKRDFFIFFHIFHPGAYVVVCLVASQNM